MAMHSQNPQKWEMDNERWRSLCDGAGALCVCETRKNAVRFLKMSECRLHKIANPPKRIADCVGRPRRRADDKAKRAADEHRSLISPSAMRHCLRGRLHARYPKPSESPAHVQRCKIQSIFQTALVIVAEICKLYAIA